MKKVQMTSKRNKTGFIGVQCIQRTGQFTARVQRKGKVYYGGCHLTPVEAAAARKAILYVIDDLPRIKGSGN